MAAIKIHHTPIDKEGSWDARANLRRLGDSPGASKLRAMHAWVDENGDPDAMSSYKLPHHNVSEDGSVGAANIKAVASAIAALNGARGGVDIPEDDRRAVYAHLAVHYEDADLDPPPLKSGDKLFETKAFPVALEIEGGANLVGVASVYGSMDSFGDVIEKGAFKKTIAENPEIPVLWQHDPREPIGVAKLEDTGKRLIARITLDLEDPTAQKALRKARLGVLKGLSIGFQPMKFTYDTGPGDTVIRRLSEIKLWEVSLVTFPALEQAQITEAKEVTPEQPGADIDRKADKREPLDSTLAEIMEILKRWTN